MLGSPEVIAALQQAIGAEARLNLQYRLDWRSVKFMGARKVAKRLKEFGSDAHLWLRKATDRLLFLEAVPAYSIGDVAEGASLTETLQKELELEMGIVSPYEQSVQAAMEALDDTTRNLFEHLLKWHELHIGWLEQQLRLIEQLGEKDYIAEKI